MFVHEPVGQWFWCHVLVPLIACGARIVHTRLSKPLEGKGELIKVVYYFLVAMVAGAGQQGSR